MTLLPALAPGVVEGFAAGTLLSAACLLLVIALQRAGRQRPDLPAAARRRARLRVIRWHRIARPRASRTWPAQLTTPQPSRAEDASFRTPLARGGRHAAPAGGSIRLAARRR